MSVKQECPECHGSGSCVRCGGSGGGDSARTLCPDCHGSGECPRCEGEGVLPEEPWSAAQRATVNPR